MKKKKKRSQETPTANEEKGARGTGGIRQKKADVDSEYGQKKQRVSEHSHNSNFKHEYIRHYARPNGVYVCESVC